MTGEIRERMGEAREGDQVVRLCSGLRREGLGES